MSASDSPDKIVEAAALGVSLDGNQVLGDVVLMLPSRSLVGLIGPNGSGKTTLLRAVGGLVGYTGSLRVAGKEVNEWKRALFAQRVAFVRPATSMAFDFRVFDLVLLARSVRKRWLQPYSDEDDAVAHRALESVDLDRLKDRSIHALSSGEQQRVFLAQAMAQEPELLLLDEPTSHLDIHHQFSFMDRIRRFVDEGGSAIAAVHDLELACRYSDYLVILDKGRLVDFGRPGTILTERLIEKVFRVRAEVSTDADRVENIRYVGSA